jgi:hypothetical protein
MKLVMVSIPLVVLAGVVVLVLCRYVGLKVWQAVVCVLFGLLLAATVAGPAIGHALSSLLALL